MGSTECSTQAMSRAESRAAGTYPLATGPSHPWLPTRSFPSFHETPLPSTLLEKKEVPRILLHGPLTPPSSDKPVCSLSRSLIHKSEPTCHPATRKATPKSGGYFGGTELEWPRGHLHCQRIAPSPTQQKSVAPMRPGDPW